MRAAGDTRTQHDDGNRRHSNGKGQHGDMRHDDSDKRQHGDERHDNAAKRGQRATRQCGTTMVTGSTTTARGSMATCGTTMATGVSMATARGSRATGGTATVTGNTTRRHDEGDVRRTTTIIYFILVRLAED